MSEFQIRQEQIDVERKFRAMNNCGHESDLTRLREERDRYREALEKIERRCKDTHIAYDGKNYVSHCKNEDHMIVKEALSGVDVTNGSEGEKK